MVLMKIATCLFLLVTACGSPVHSKPSLQGLWSFNDTLGLKVSGDSYELAHIVPLNTGSFGIDVELGTFTEQQIGTIDTIPTQASCPSHDHSAGSFTYEMPDVDHLRLNLPEGIVVFERIQDDATSSAVAQYGCIDGSTFTTHPLTNL